MHRATRYVAPERTGPERLHREIARHSVDVVLCNYATMAVDYDVTLRRLGIPVFVHCHGIDVHFNARRDTAPYAKVHPDEYQARVVRLAEYATFIANSRHTERVLLQAGVPADRIRLKYFGVETSPNRAFRPDREGRPSILFLGRLVDFKGPELVLRAFNSAVERGMCAELTIAGDGPLRVVLDLMRLESPRPDWIHIVGAVDRAKASELYRSADIFTAHHRCGPLTGREEAFGVTVIEAMSHGLPVVTGRSGGVIESVIDGETGVLFDPGDTAGHAAALYRLASDAGYRRRLGDNACQHVGRHFTIDIERKRLLEILWPARGEQ